MCLHEENRHLNYKLGLFTHFHVVSNLYAYISSVEHKRSFEKYLRHLLKMKVNEDQSYYKMIKKNHKSSSYDLSDCTQSPLKLNNIFV